MNFAQLSSETLTARVSQLLGHERRIVVAFLFHLAELEERQLHLGLGYSSLFGYCTDALRLSKAAAFRRTTAARLLRRYPRAAPYLESGELCLTTLVELRDVLTEENHERTLADAAGKTEDQVRELVAALRPRPAPPDLFRRLPAPSSSGPEPAAPQARPSDDVRPAEPPPSSRTRGRLEPISDELRVLRVTVGREFAQDLDKVRALLSHKLPGGGLEQVLHECIRQTIAACEKRRRGGTKPRAARPKPASPQPPSRHIPADVRRAVWERDGGQCAFVGATAMRCGSTHRVEFHHLRPYALGGEATVPNIALRCGRHNAYEAEQELGRAGMDEARRRPETLFGVYGVAVAAQLPEFRLCRDRPGLVERIQHGSEQVVVVDPRRARRIEARGSDEVIPRLEEFFYVMPLDTSLAREVGAHELTA